MKRSIDPILAAFFTVVLLTMLLGIDDRGGAFAQTASSTCPSLRILAIFARDQSQWLLLGSDKSLTTPVAIELTTNTVVATYAVPSVTFAEPLDGSIGYRSTPIALASPLDTVISVSARSTLDANSTCPVGRRDVLVRDDQGVYAPVPVSREDQLSIGIISRAPQPTTGPLAPTARRYSAAPTDCKVSHRDAKTTRPKEPDYPNRARMLGATGMVMIKLSLSSTGAVAAASVYRSSGNDDIDQAAMIAAVSSTYAPEIENCVPGTGGYIFRADFNSQ